MAEYIERDLALSAMNMVVTHANAVAGNSVIMQKVCSILEDCKNIVAVAPAADVVPAVHGRWIECDYVKYDGHSECIHYPKAAWKCSNCCNAFKKELLWKDNYCPNCGAHMKDGE